MNAPAISRTSMEDRSYYARGREVFIRLSLLAMMGISCAILLHPFIKVLLCGIILSIAIHPVYRMLSRAMGGRRKLSAVLCSLFLLAVIIVPCAMMADTLVEGIQSITRQMQAGRLDIPPPPSSLHNLPIVGPRLEGFWILCTTNIAEAVSHLTPQIQKAIPILLSASASIAGVILQFLIAIVFAGFLLATSEANGLFAHRVFVRIFGEKGSEFEELIESTIRTVTNGILGVAFLQTLFASLGFWAVGLPGAGLWALAFLVSSVLQVAAIVLLPAILYGFATFSTTHALLFFAWCLVVGLMDNVLKPILLGRGGKVPMGVIFLGVLGGFIVMDSLIGLFVGAIILSVGYKMFIAWLDSELPHAVDPSQAIALRNLRFRPRWTRHGIVSF